MIGTHVDEARDGVESERASVRAHREALAAFADRLPEGAASTPAGASAGTPPAAVAGAVTGSAAGCAQVRAAFAETVQPHAEADTTGAALREEFGPDVALALADGQFVPPVRRQVLVAVEERRTQLSVGLRALKREAESLAAAAETVDRVTEWLADADEVPLSALGFEALRDRHERLGRHRETCQRTLAERQDLLGATTGANGTVGLPHRHLVDSLYEDCAVAFPVLSTVTRLCGLLDECRRTVRAHLVRRA